MLKTFCRKCSRCVCLAFAEFITFFFRLINFAHYVYNKYIDVECILDSKKNIPPPILRRPEKQNSRVHVIFKSRASTYRRTDSPSRSARRPYCVFHSNACGRQAGIYFIVSRRGLYMFVSGGPVVFIISYFWSMTSFILAEFTQFCNYISCSKKPIDKKIKLTPGKTLLWVPKITEWVIIPSKN